MQVIPEGRPVALTPLWLGIIGPPVAWATQLVIAYVAAEGACSPGSTTDDLWGVSVNVIGIVVTVLAAAATVVCGLMAERARHMPPAISRASAHVRLFLSR